MDLSKTIGDLKLRDVAQASGIPIATLCRWRKRGEIPGSEPVQEFRFRIIKEAADKLRSESQAA